jgi:hypothetical protein
MSQRVTRVSEVYEHEAALCHASPPTRSSFSLESRLSPVRDRFKLLASAILHDGAGIVALLDCSKAAGNGNRTMGPHSVLI